MAGWVWLAPEGEMRPAVLSVAAYDQARARELAARYEREHGHAPGKAAWFRIKQQAALETRRRFLSTQRSAAVNRARSEASTIDA